MLFRSSGGGKNIPVGTTVAIPNPVFGSVKIEKRGAFGQTIVTGLVTNPVFPAGVKTVTFAATEAGSANLNAANVGFTGTTAADFVAAVSAANIPYVSAEINSSGQIVIIHSQGGNINTTQVSGTPMTTAGFTPTTPFCQLSTNPNFPNTLGLSNWIDEPEWTYTPGSVAPDQNPANGRL